MSASGGRHAGGATVAAAIAAALLAGGVVLVVTRHGTSSAPTSSGRRTLVIDGTGDVTLDPSLVAAFRRRGYAWAWSGLAGMFRRDALTVVNLECPATRVDDPAAKPYAYRCDPAGLRPAAAAGVDVASQANNHALDQGPRGLLDSIERLRAAGIASVGAGRTADEALAPVVRDVGGWRVAVMGIDQVPGSEPIAHAAPGPGTERENAALRAVGRIAAEADIVVVAIHWGIELATRPRPYQLREAHNLVDAGADVIFGSHAHRLQPMETYRGRPIFYGLGNFVWPAVSPDAARTAVARVTISPDGEYDGRLLPATIVSDGHPVLG